MAGRAYGKTVWSWPSLPRSSRSKMCASPTGQTASSIRTAREARRNGRLPGDHGISRPATAQGRPSDRRHLYAAVRFFLRVHFRAADRGCQPAPGLPCALLDQRVAIPGKARAKRAARTRRHVCKQNASWRVRSRNSARHCGRSEATRIAPRKDFGLLRREGSRNDVESACATLRPRAPPLLGPALRSVTACRSASGTRERRCRPCSISAAQ